MTTYKEIINRANKDIFVALILTFIIFLGLTILTKNISFGFLFSFMYWFTGCILANSNKNRRLLVYEMSKIMGNKIQVIQDIGVDKKCSAKRK